MRLSTIDHRVRLARSVRVPWRRVRVWIVPLSHFVDGDDDGELEPSLVEIE